MAISTERNTCNATLTSTEAEALWRSIQGELGVWIAGIVRTMGVPTPLARTPGGSSKDAPGRVPGTRAIKQALINDLAMYDDIQQEIGIAFFNAAARGSVPSGDDARRYVYGIVRHTTWRVMHARARDMRRTLEPTTHGDVAERISATVPSPEDVAATREIVIKLFRLVEALGDDERELLLAAEDESYSALAERLGSSEGALRVRAFRLRNTLRERLSVLTDDDASRRKRRRKT